MKKIERKIHVLDASGQILGRLASQAANLLNGKHKVDYAANWDLGDFVIIKNAAKVKLTGKKLTQKVLRHHTTHPGGLKTRQVKDLFKTNAPEVLKHAVSRMLPKNRLRSPKLTRLKIEA